VIQTQVGIRTAEEADAEAVHAFLAGLSPNAQYQRFFTGLGSVSPSLVRELVTVTPCQQIVVAVLAGQVIGHAMATTNKTGAIELGVVVADEYRHRGVGTRLIQTLIEHAATSGARELRLDVLVENRLVLDWIRRGLPDTVFERDGHTLTGFARLSAAMATAPAA
jgi:acetyltransferase